SDVLAQVALRHSAELVRAPVANARDNLGTLEALAARVESLSLVPPRAGLSAFARFADAATLQRRLAADGVLVVPGELFGCTDHLRIWLGGSTAEFAFAVEEIGRHLADLSPTPA
ncbi:MAG: aminotransferase class I/II-fold pyridoxal phosphate-dependent enzyme, partial [Candidatus Limnocylindria bacterium]